jgi:hypothetical protein
MSGVENSDRGGRSAEAGALRILCAGISVVDEVFHVENFPPPDGKAAAKGFFVVNGGCAANAAITVARLGGRAALAGPMGSDANGDFVLAALAREPVDCTGCQRVPGAATALSVVFINARGERTIVTYRDENVAAVVPPDPEGLAAAADVVLADNWYPVFVQPICEAARRRGLRIVLDADKPSQVDDPLFRICTTSSSPRSAFGPRPAAPTLPRDCSASLRTPTPSSRSATGQTIFSSSRALRSAACRYSQSTPWTRSAPAMHCTAPSRSRSPRDAAKPRGCASPPLSPD